MRRKWKLIFLGSQSQLKKWRIISREVLSREKSGDGGNTMTDLEIIKDTLGRKEMEELLTIWTQNRRDEYRDEAFNAIQKSF